MAFIGALSGALGNLPTPPTPPTPGSGFIGGGFIGGNIPTPPIPSSSGGFIGGWTPPTPPIPSSSGGFIGGNIPTPIPSSSGGFIGGGFIGGGIPLVPPTPPTPGTGFIGGVFNPPNPPTPGGMMIGPNTGNVPYHTHNIQTTGPNNPRRNKVVLGGGVRPTTGGVIPGGIGTTALGGGYGSIPRPMTGPAGLPVSPLQAPTQKFSNASGGCSLWMCNQD